MRAQRKCEIMAIDKLNFFNQLPAVSGYNVIPTAPASRHESEPTLAPANGSLVGVNSNLGVGSQVNLASQVGKPPGVGRTLGFA